MRNSWFADSPSAGVFFGALTSNGTSAAGHRGVFGAMSDVYVWGQNGAARMEQILQSDNSTLKSYYTTTKNQESSRVNVTESNVHYNAPPGGATSPALQWRERAPVRHLLGLLLVPRLTAAVGRSQAARDRP